MHSSRMRTARAMTGHISWGGVHTTHAPPLPHMPPFAMHAPLHHARSPTFATHTPLCHACPPSPCMPPPPEQPRMPPGATTHAPREQPRMTPWEQPHMSPGSNHAHPPGETTHAPPPVNRMINRCKNITLPQTSFAGGNKQRHMKSHK